MRRDEHTERFNKVKGLLRFNQRTPLPRRRRLTPRQLFGGIRLTRGCRCRHLRIPQLAQHHRLLCTQRQLHLRLLQVIHVALSASAEGQFRRCRDPRARHQPRVVPGSPARPNRVETVRVGAAGPLPLRTGQMPQSASSAAQSRLGRCPSLSRITPAAIGVTPLILSVTSRISLMCESSLGV